jgi:hypothetical protein
MTSELIKPEDYEIDLTEWNALSIKAERIADAITVDSDEEEQMGINSLADIKRFQKQVEGARKDQVDPFNKLVKRVNDIFRPIGDGLEKSESVIKDKIKQWRIKKESIRQEEEHKRQIEYQKKIAKEQVLAKKERREAEIIVPPPTVIQTQTRGTTSTASSRSVWKYEIVDESKIPDDYFVLDESKIKAMIRSGTRDIPGIRIFEDFEISVRT